MKRRTVLKSPIILASTASFLSSCSTVKAPEKTYLSGFIFSDAHIGWRGADQPSIEEQSQAIQTIKSQFPNIDLIFDTGDLHHGYLNETERNIARNQWLTHFISPFSEKMFHYVPGNHELGRGPSDTELVASQIGSQNLRPYYSFDYNGIHFISVPQLLDTILVNQETINWLKHDLQINKNKTTIILSHNSIKDTTYDNGENGYRTVINSHQVLSVINKHNNVIAWLHGHNHLYEIVKRDQRLYVSNGRIGGFNPPEEWGPYGHGHLGGIYFAISKKGLVVKSYSATKKDFLANLGFPNLSDQLNVETTFNPAAQMHYYYGHGKLTNNVKHQMTNHFLSKSDATVFTRTIQSPVMNDNSKFNLTSELFFVGKRMNKTVGYQIIPKTVHRKTTKQGLKLTNPTDENLVVNLPSQRTNKFNYLERGSYFRCESSDRFAVKLNTLPVKDEITDGKVKYSFRVLDSKHNTLYESAVAVMDGDTPGHFKTTFSIPELSEGISKYLKLSFVFENHPKKFILSQLALEKVTEPNEPQTLLVNSKEFNISEKKNFSIKQDELTSSGQAPLVYSGDRSLSCVIKIKNVQWQVRNAVATYEGETIDLLSYRHKYQIINEATLTPTSPRDFYVNKVVDLMPVKITYKNNGVGISLEKVNSQSALVFVTRRKPQKVIGSEVIDYTKNRLILKPTTKNITITL